MKKTLLNLGKQLNKEDQQLINGGLILLNGCERICKTAPRGTRCYQQGYLAACDGVGGFIYF